MNKYIIYVVSSIILSIIKVIADNENYDGQDVSGQSFTEGSYVGSSWKNATAINTKFTRSDCSNASFIEANLTNANFQSSNLTNADFTNAIIEKTYFTNVENFTKEQLYSTQSYKDKNLSGISFYGNNLIEWNFNYQNLKGADFFNANLQNAGFSGASLVNTRFTRADLRGANINNITGNYITEHTIMTNGNINNFNMDSLGDNFSIRKYTPASEGGEMISAKISEAAAISGGAALTLENGAELEVLNAADLTVENGSSIIINTDADSSTSFKVNSGGGLAFENGAILEINVVSDLSAQDILQIEIMEFAENASIAGLDALVKGETILLNVNGSEWLGEWDYALENNQMLITVSVPEPAVCAAAIGALALGLALRYRNYKN